MGNWKVQLKNLAGNISTIADSQCVYLHRSTGTMLNIEKLDNGGIRVEVPVPQAKLSKIFIIGTSKDNVALNVKMGKQDPVEKMMFVGEKAFHELQEIFRDSSIVRDSQKQQTQVNQQEAPFHFIDKVNGWL